jgi:hypothetical protein
MARFAGLDLSPGDGVDLVAELGAERDQVVGVQEGADPLEVGLPNLDVGDDRESLGDQGLLQRVADRGAAPSELPIRSSIRTSAEVALGPAQLVGKTAAVLPARSMAPARTPWVSAGPAAAVVDAACPERVPGSSRSTTRTTPSRQSGRSAIPGRRR